MANHYDELNNATAEWQQLMNDIEHAPTPDIELLDTGRYPVLVMGVVRVDSLENAEELLREVA
jgi:hypothetical protein